MFPGQQGVTGRSQLWPPRLGIKLLEGAPSTEKFGKGDQVIREDPCRGTEKSAEDLVGPPERMLSEPRSTAVVILHYLSRRTSHQPSSAQVSPRPRRGPARHTSREQRTSAACGGSAGKGGQLSAG